MALNGADETAEPLPRRSLVRWPSVAWQVVHLGTGGVLYLALWLILGRYWGVERFGQFNYLFAVTSLCGVFADFGLDVLLTRMVAHRGLGISRTMVWMKLALTAGFFLVFSLVGVGLGLPLLEQTLLLVGVVFLSATTLLNAILRGQDRLDVEARIGLVQKIVFAGGGMAGVIFWGGGILWVAGCYLVSHALGLALTARRLAAWAWVRVKEATEGVGTLFAEAWPLWAVALLTMLSVRIDVFLLEGLLGERAVGLYSAASRLVEGLTIVATAYMAAVFPRIVGRLRDRGRLRWLLVPSVGLLVGAALVVAIVGYVAAPWLIETLFGDEFRESTLVLRGLVPALVAVYVTMLLGQVLMAGAMQRLYAAALLAAVALNGLVDLVAIPQWGVMGAVVGYWAREVVLVAVLGYLVVTRKEILKAQGRGMI